MRCVPTKPQFSVFCDIITTCVGAVVRPVARYFQAVTRGLALGKARGFLPPGNAGVFICCVCLFLLFLFGFCARLIIMCVNYQIMLYLNLLHPLNEELF